MTARPGEVAMEAWRLLLEAHARLTRVLDAELRDRHGIGLDWYDVLFQLSHAGGDLRMSDLAEVTLFSRSDVTRLVDRMQAGGLVTRRKDDADRRGVHAVLTPKGRHVLRRAALTHVRGIQQHFAAKSEPGELAVVRDVLGRVVS